MDLPHRKGRYGIDAPLVPLLMAAACVPRGRAMGVDIWSSRDQSGNRLQATADNAVAEDISRRVELKTADMRELRFADGNFDMVVSRMAMHNIGSPNPAGFSLYTLPHSYPQIATTHFDPSGG